MTRRDATPSFDAISSVRDDAGLHHAQLTAAEIKRGWRHGGRLDAAAALEGHPELRAYRSLAIDLAHSEYQLRLEAGEELKTYEFCQRFPTLEQSLYLLIRVGSLLEHDPAFQDLQQQVPWPKPGDTFLGYRLVSELGRGAFGRVFLAREPALGNRQVALKVALRGDDEANVLGKLRHPNIVPVHSVHWDDATGLAAFCMPYFGRATLRDVLDRVSSGGELPARASVILDAIRSANEGVDTSESVRPGRAPSERWSGTMVEVLRSGSYVDGVVYLAARLADALAHSHRCGIYHRDLKPSNVLLSADGQPFLLDFNLSVDGGLPACRIGGTLPYMAPEVVTTVLGQTRAADARHYDPRSDVFSLGVILYETLTRELPFGDTARDVPLEESAGRLREQQAAGPKPVQEKNRHVDNRLARLVHRCLSFDANDRPQSAGEMAEGLRKELAPHRRAWRWIRDHRRRVTVAASVLLLLAVTGIGYVVTRPPYPLRQFQRGIAFSEQGDYAAAIEHFDSSLRANPEQSVVLFARGRALVRQGDFSAALADFRAARALTPDPRVDACLGYCSARINDYKAAVYYGEQAVAKGLESPGLLNNLGFSYRRLNSLDRAEAYLQRAIAADEHLTAAYLNLLVLHSNRAIGRRAVPESAVVQAKTAVELAPPSAEVYDQVSVVLACAAREHAELIQPAIAYLEKAVAHGLDPVSLRTHPGFSALRAHAAFEAILTKPTGREPSVTPDYLVDPLYGAATE